MKLRKKNLEKARNKILQKAANGKPIGEMCTILNFEEFGTSNDNELLACFTSSEDSTTSTNIRYLIWGELCKFLCTIDPHDEEGMDRLTKSLQLTKLGLAVLPNAWKNIIRNLPANQSFIHSDGSKCYLLDSQTILTVYVAIVGNFDERVVDGEVRWGFKQPK